MSIVSEYPIKPGLAHLIADAKRELAMRERLLHRWVSEGKYGMTRELADYRIRCQRYIVENLEGQLAGGVQTGLDLEDLA